MRAKEFDIKKRDPNWRAMQDIRRSGAGGQHKNKKKAEKQGQVKHKARMAEGVPQPGPSSGAPKQFGSDAKIQTRQMTVKDIISSVPDVPYYNNVVDDWDAKDYSWGVTKKVIEYATYLKDHPESLAKLPPAIVLNGKFEDGAHRVSAIWLLQQRMDPKNPLWENAKLNVQFVKQGVAEVTGDKPFDDMMRQIKKGTKKQATADRKAEREKSRKRARDAFGPNPFASLSIRKKDVEEDQVDESKGSKVVQNLVDKFYDDNEIEWSDGNIYVKDPGTRVWTRGDGTRYRDPGKIRAKDDRDAKQLKAFFPWLIKQPGVKHLGKLSGSFASEEPGDVYAIGGIYFKLMNHNIIEWGSVSRFKNPRSVWKQQPKSADVDEDQVNELSSDLLGRYKKGASADATAADKKGDYKQGDKRFSGIVKATKKQFANDKKVKEGLGDVEFEVDGWKYRAEEEDEGDVIKLYHSATSPEGKTLDIDFSPYETMTPELFKLWVKLGMPERQGSGPLNKETLLKMAKTDGVKEASYEGNIGIMELFKFFSKAEKEDPKLVARVKEMIKQRRDKEVWRIIQDYTGTELTGKEFEGSIKEAIFREAGHGKYWCSTDKKWEFRKGSTESRGS